MPLTLSFLEETIPVKFESGETLDVIVSANKFNSETQAPWAYFIFKFKDASYTEFDIGEVYRFLGTPKAQVTETQIVTRFYEIVDYLEEKTFVDQRSLSNLIAGYLADFNSRIASKWTPLD